MWIIVRRPGLSEHKNNPACTNECKSLQNVEVGHYRDEEEEH